MPVLAACRICTPLPMPSSRLLMSLARASSPAAVKKVVGVSSAVLPILTEARQLWLVASRSAVGCREEGCGRIEVERTAPDSDHLTGAFASGHPDRLRKDMNC